MKLRSFCAHPGLAFETIPAPGPWIADAACAGEPTDLFFPEDESATELAKSICGRCKVRAQCVSYAIDIPSLDGVWGGLTRQERLRLRRKMACARRTAKQPRCNEGSPLSA
jgi:WhiB family transcriptional regulator, redox-sensing transcriptional regulator